MELAAFIQFGKKIFMIKLNKNKFGFLNNNLVLPSMIITLICFPFLSYAGGASMHSPIEQFVVKKIFAEVKQLECIMNEVVRNTVA